MTLVLTCVTSNHVVQVSDRRLTYLNGKLADDHSNKAVVVCNRLAVSYTGLAAMPTGDKTDEWVLEVASHVIPYSPQRVCEAIAEQATEVFRRVRLSGVQKRHAFLLSGWAKFNQSDEQEAFVCAISNALDDRWRWLSQAEDKFRAQPISVGERAYLLAKVGQTLDRTAQIRLGREVRAYVRRERGPAGYVQLLANAIRVTARNNPYVGRNLMAISLPRAALNSNIGLNLPIFQASPMWDSNTPLAIYLPESSDAPVRYGPNYTCNGMTMKGVSLRFTE